jgi:hypothetical protein
MAASPHIAPLCKDSFLAALDRTSFPPSRLTRHRLFVCPIQHQAFLFARSLFGFPDLGKEPPTIHHESRFDLDAQLLHLSSIGNQRRDQRDSFNTPARRNRAGQKLLKTQRAQLRSGQDPRS